MTFSTSVEYNWEQGTAYHRYFLICTRTDYNSVSWSWTSTSGQWTGESLNDTLVEHMICYISYVSQIWIPTSLGLPVLEMKIRKIGNLYYSIHVRIFTCNKLDYSWSLSLGYCGWIEFNNWSWITWHNSWPKFKGYSNPKLISSFIFLWNVGITHFTVFVRWRHRHHDLWPSINAVTV